MNTKIKTLLQQLLLSPKKFPVEAALGLAFFLISAWHLHTAEWSNVTGRMEGDLNADILWLFVPLIVLSFWLRKVNRWLYFASLFLFVPLMALNLKPFLWTYGFHTSCVGRQEDEQSGLCLPCAPRGYPAVLWIRHNRYTEFGSIVHCCLFSLYLWHQSTQPHL